MQAGYENLHKRQDLLPDVKCALSTVVSKLTDMNVKKNDPLVGQIELPSTPIFLGKIETEFGWQQTKYERKRES